jgi:hypothetical protein
MTTEEKKQAIKQHCVDMLAGSFNQIERKIDKALNCGAIDADQWDESHNFMILPKSILSAVLISEAIEYSGKGTGFEKEMKKDINNLRHFI